MFSLKAEYLRLERSLLHDALLRALSKEHGNVVLYGCMIPSLCEVHTSDSWLHRLNDLHLLGVKGD
jgi:hypothetical protein